MSSNPYSPFVVKGTNKIWMVRVSIFLVIFLLIPPPPPHNSEAIYFQLYGLNHPPTPQLVITLSYRNSTHLEDKIVICDSFLQASARVTLS